MAYLPMSRNLHVSHILHKSLDSELHNLHIRYQSNRRREMTTITKTGQVLTVKETKGRFFAWSPRALRWLPVKRSEVIF